MAENPVLNTLLYESIFEFPLYKEELWKLLISHKKISNKEFEQLIHDKRIYFDSYTKLYSIEKGKKIFKERSNRALISKKKYKIAIPIIQSISKIPTINFIGISGSLAQYSAKKDDDIDLFVICKKNTVWITRFIAVIFLKLRGAYREEGKSNNRICLNMITDLFSIPNDRRDLYNAFEIAQMNPLFSRNNGYLKIISANKWIDKFLPNFRNITKFTNNKIESEIKNSSLYLTIISFFVFEQIAKIIQKLYMKKITSETVTDSLLAFHPIDFRNEILTKYEELLKDY